MTATVGMPVNATSAAGSPAATDEGSGGVGSSLWLSGIVPPVCTPLTPDHEVDVRSLERLIEWQLDAGVAGLFMLGSSGEVAFLPDAQRDVVIEVAVGVAAGAVPVLAGAIDMTTSRVIEHARRAIAGGADAIVATAPFYAGTTHPVEVEHHFRAIKAATEVDLVAYNIPGAVHSTIDSALLIQLAADGIIQAVKDSSGDLATLRRTLAGLADVPGFSTFTGSELLVDVSILAGAAGAVPGLANIDPHGYVELYNTCRKGDWAAARLQQDRLVRLNVVITCGRLDRRTPGSSAFAAFKAALMLRGIISTNDVGLPQAPFDDDEMANVRQVLLQAGLL